MEKERNAKNVVIVALVLTVMFMSAAFAGMGQNLEVNGTVTLPNAEWDVGFDSINWISTSVGEEPQITNTNNTVTFEVELNEGDTYEFDAVILNNGTYNARLVTYTVSEVPEALANVLTYEVTELTAGTTNGAIISAKDDNSTNDELTINVKISMATIADDDDLAAVKAAGSVKFTILAEFAQVVE